LTLRELPWHWVNGRARTQTITPIETTWLELLNSPHAETEIQRFLGDHPQFFLVRSPATHFVLQEIRLGGDFTIDFVVPTDEASVGVTYELIEIERPDTPPFTRDGTPSRRLSHAIQQTVDWKTWLMAHPAELRHIFPAPAQIGPGYESSFEFTVVIGTRQNSAGHLARRNALAKATGVAIRSFDSLTDQLRRGWHQTPGPLTQSAEANSVPFDVAAVLKNPFFRALGDAEWRALRQKLAHHRHLVASNAALFAESRVFNQEALGRFQAYCDAEPREDLEAELSMARELYAAAIAPIEPPPDSEPVE
jgi:hypothetical protein